MFCFMVTRDSSELSQERWAVITFRKSVSPLMYRVRESWNASLLALFSLCRYYIWEV